MFGCRSGSHVMEPDIQYSILFHTSETPCQAATPSVRSTTGTLREVAQNTSRQSELVGKRHGDTKCLWTWRHHWQKRALCSLQRPNTWQRSKSFPSSIS